MVTRGAYNFILSLIPENTNTHTHTHTHLVSPCFWCMCVCVCEVWRERRREWERERERERDKILGRISFIVKANAERDNSSRMGPCLILREKRRDGGKRNSPSSTRKTTNHFWTWSSWRTWEDQFHQHFAESAKMLIQWC